MSRRATASKRANYGIDAPAVLRNLLVCGGSAIALGSLIYALRDKLPRNLSTSLANTGWWAGGSLVLTALVMLWGSRVGKLRLRDKLLGSFAWRGDERVLDVGCGHGLMLIGAARRLTTGKAVGVDIWQKEDQAGNSMEATLDNAIAEGVAERVELKDGDARQLPFANDTFDAIVSSWALHNIYDAKERERAVSEIARVLKPGGRVLIVDIKHTNEYARVLRESGLVDVERHGPSLLFVTPTHWLTAVKTHAP
ncbi:MAG TPA: class I SAM-dependent methyltransferase [Pyrinomonadaceae bacterium]